MERQIAVFLPDLYILNSNTAEISNSGFDQIKCSEILRFKCPPNNLCFVCYVTRGVTFLFMLGSTRHALHHITVDSLCVSTFMAEPLVRRAKRLFKKMDKVALSIQKF